MLVFNIWSMLCLELYGRQNGVTGARECRHWWNCWSGL